MANVFDAKLATKENIRSLYALTTWFIPMVSVQAEAGCIPLSYPDAFLGMIGPAPVWVPEISM